MDDNKIPGAIYLDLSKSFDTLCCVRQDGMCFYLLRYYGEYQITPVTIQNKTHLEIISDKSSSKNTI